MRNSYDVIEIDFVILNTVQIFFISENILFLSINLDLKHAEPNIGKIFKTNIDLIIKYLNLNCNIVKSSIFYRKILILNKNFKKC